MTSALVSPSIRAEQVTFMHSSQYVAPGPRVSSGGPSGSDPQNGQGANLVF